MITTGAKFFFGLAALAIVAGIALSWGSHGGLTGALTGGFYGGIGDHTGYIVLFGAAAASLFAGGMIVAFRDADPEAQRAVARLDVLPEVPAPHNASYWPILGAVAAGCAVVGLVSSSLLFIFGVVLGVAVLLEWMVSAWSDRATGDPEVNQRIRSRTMSPIEIPVFGAIGVVAFVLCISRVLLAATEHGSAIVAMTVAILILVFASIYAVAPKAGRTIVATLAVLLAVGVIAGGVIGAAEGSRTYEKQEEQLPSQSPDRRQGGDPAAQLDQAQHNAGTTGAGSSSSSSEAN
jgi:hypothetical protein